MSFNHNDLKNIQGGQDTGGTGVTDVTDFYHLTEAAYNNATALTVGEFNVSLGVESIVEDTGLAADSKIFLMAQDTDAAALATAGLSVAAGVGSFTATHGSAEATAGKFSYLFI